MCVRAGKVRYIGASSMWAWQFSKALYTSAKHGWARFVTMQPHYNLLYREEEREMMPLCADQGVGVIPWSPLARGKLARPWGEQGTARSGTDTFGKGLYSRTGDIDEGVVRRLGEVAAARGVSQAQVALAWLLTKPVVTAPIVGATKLHHLEDAVAAVELKLTTDEVKALEEPYVAHPVLGLSYSYCAGSSAEESVVAFAGLDLEVLAAGEVELAEGAVGLGVGGGVAEQELGAQLVLDLVEGVFELLAVVAYVDDAASGVVGELLHVAGAGEPRLKPPSPKVRSAMRMT